VYACRPTLLFGLRRASDKVEVFNIGSEDRVDVKTIARMLIEEMGLGDVKLRFAGELDGRGWPGDVKEMQLDIGKIKRLGWKPTLTISSPKTDTLPCTCI
jgi:UDP-glucose 4-epimerase